MTMAQTQKAAQFQALHQRAGAFLIANPWDAGSALVLAGLGFEAFATSSGAAAATFGRRDGKLSRDEALASARAIASAADLPVSADLENGFGDAPDTVAETVQMAAGAGLVGCSIEDATADKNRPLYEHQLATERIAAAVHKLLLEVIHFASMVLPTFDTTTPERVRCLLWRQGRPFTL